MNSSILLDFGMNKIDPIEINLWKLEINLSNLAKVIYLRGIDNKTVRRYVPYSHEFYPHRLELLE